MSDREQEGSAGVSRREFLKISGIAAASMPLIAGPAVLKVAGEDVAIHGPDKTPITLNVNGKNYSAQIEPRVTLLDALRQDFEITGPKRVCDRGACGACTVLMDGKAVYSCSVLAIEAQDKPIVTVDAQQCGFCTPGFVVATKAFLDKHPHPTPEQVHRGLGGNFCRCGTYDGIRKVVSQLGKA